MSKRNDIAKELWIKDNDGQPRGSSEAEWAAYSHHHDGDTYCHYLADVVIDRLAKAWDDAIDDVAGAIGGEEAEESKARNPYRTLEAQ